MPPCKTIGDSLQLTCAVRCALCHWARQTVAEWPISNLLFPWFRECGLENGEVVTMTELLDSAPLWFQNVGVGKFRPNLLLMGFKSNWSTDDPENIHEYFCVIQSVHMFWVFYCDLCAEQLSDGLRFVFSPDIILSGWLGWKRQLTHQHILKCTYQKWRSPLLERKEIVSFGRKPLNFVICSHSWFPRLVVSQFKVLFPLDSTHNKL